MKQIKETVNSTNIAAKKRKLSTEYLSGDEVDEATKWNLEDKLNNNSRYNASFVRYLDAKGYNYFLF